MEDKVAEIRELAAALAESLEPLQGPLADRAKALLADAVQVAVQSASN